MAFVLTCVALASAQDDSLGTLEDFALSTDRDAVLERMLPGTDDASYFRCLQLQGEGRLDEVAPLLEAWRKRSGETARWKEIERRQALISFATRPETTYQYLERELHADFSHRRELPGEIPDLPTSLDPTLVSRDTLVRAALAAGGAPLGHVRDQALPAFVGEALDGDQLHALLSRLDLPDVSNLPALVVRDLDHKLSRGFGSLPVHRKMLMAQLEECARIRPALLGDEAFVDEVVKRLLPPDGVDWDHDPAVREAYLDRLWSWAQRLPSGMDAFRAHVLYHRLDHDRRKGVYDRDRFLAYLRLPRRGAQVDPKLLDDARRAGHEPASLDAEFPTGFDVIGDETPLVRDELAHMFVIEDSIDAYAPYLDDDFLTRVLAETKIVNGLGDAERWYALLDDPAAYEKIEQQVEISFPPTEPQRFAVTDVVALDVDVKNVPTLLVKVFEIDTFNVYSETGREVDASLALDGLVAHDERVVAYDDPPARRVRRHFEFPALDHPGVWVIEFIGNGVSSRAVVRKGVLRFTERRSAAGHALTVFDEGGRKLSDTRAWMDGVEYRPDADGEIVVPYSASPGQRDLVLRRGDFASLAHLALDGEDYALRAGTFVERESLLAGRTARIVLRPSLELDGVPVSLALLDDPMLHVVTTDLDGVRSTDDVPVQPVDGADLVYEIPVPEGLVQLSVSLGGKVQRMVDGEPVALVSSEETFPVNGIDRGPRTSQRLLSRTALGWTLDVLGKNGEPLADRAQRLVLQPRDFTDAVEVSLKTDARGRVTLGALDEIESLRVRDDGSDGDLWTLDREHATHPRRLQGVATRPLRVTLPPRDGRMPKLDRSLASLIELRDGEYHTDRFQHLALVDGMLELRDLPAGDYLLVLHGDREHIDVRITAGDVHDGHVFGRDRTLELSPAPLSIASATVDGDDLVVRLANARADARVIVSSSRWTPAYRPFDFLALDLAPWPSTPDTPKGSVGYAAGRRLGSEYRYILERRFRSIFPGNMLRRPSLLLSPWALEEAPTPNDALGYSGSAGARSARSSGSGASLRGPAAPPSEAGAPPHAFANLDFLGEPGVLLADLRPDADGVLRVPRASLGGGHLVQVVALDDESTVSTSLVLPERPLVRRERRLFPGLDPSRPTSGQRRMQVLEPGASVTIEDASTAQVALHDSLGAAFRLLQGVSGDPELSQFAFLLEWPKLTKERKLELYGRYACHELHLFLHEKDRPFFDEVVRPYLANALHRTFLDHWLLDDDLSAWLAPAAYARLNAAERALLARRLPDAAESIARELRESLELQPPDPERERFLFDAALRGRALAGGALGGMLAQSRDEATTASLEALGYLGEEFAPSDGPAMLSGRARAAGADRDQLEKKAKDVLGRQIVRTRYSDLDATRAWVENEYWHVPRARADGELVPVNGFWLDLAAAQGRRPFVSTHLLEASGSLNEVLLALAVLDLPFEAEPLEPIRDGQRITLRTAGPALLVLEELAPAARDPAAPPLLVSQDVFRADSRYAWDGGRRLDVFVRGEFLVDTAYGSQVVLTNPTSSPLRVELLLQIPRGSMPLSGSRATRTLTLELPPFGTRTVENAFYFPAAGDQRMFPAQVSRDGRLVAAAEPRELHVVASPTVVDKASWEHVSQQGSIGDVLAYLGSANLQRLDLSRIAWRMRDRSAFEDVLALLRGRHVFSRVLWTYGMLHGDPVAVRELLASTPDFVRGCGAVLDSPLLSVDRITSGDYEHVEFEPLVNARAHAFAGQRRIANEALAAQYDELLDALAHRAHLTDSDWLQVTYYMVLQDRIEDALAAFARVDPTKITTRLQYDYAEAWLDFCSDDPGRARALAEPYRDHPVPRWRERFRDVLAQLDEAAGGEVAPGSPGDRSGSLTSLAAGEPSLELEVSGGEIVLRHRNLETCELRFYAMDVELLFSSRPFVQQGGTAFSSIRPNEVREVELSEDDEPLTLDLPEAFASRNVLVEARGGGVVRRAPSYSNALDVRVFESYGQLQVLHAGTGEPLSKAYVKVYARTADGDVHFHKDGYTDLRGRFDYASVSGAPGDEASFALLVLSDEYGAVVREVSPPAR
ncbi:MAG: hypothetical protein H6825_01970 [Planctomycetes bacterium]|nr:hypothetical protein [Planctomycetota bacterium]